jgi:S1-C subfamily serine protease
MRAWRGRCSANSGAATVERAGANPSKIDLMAESSNWAFPESLQPKASDVAFDLDAALDAVVMLRAEVPEDAFTAATLGTERIGSGVVIRDDGLILTIGYLITEAESIWVTTNKGMALAGHPLAYDQSTGFGLVMPLGRLSVPMLPRGSIANCAVDDELIVIGHGGRAHAAKVRVVDKREFAGYWEYVLDEALFTAPAHPQWGGTGVVDVSGKLVGIGSLFVQEVMEGKAVEGNMIVPIDLLEPILGDLLKFGASSKPPRPWLGLYVTEASGRLVVGGLAKGGPASRAGVRVGDLVMAVAGERVAKLPDLFRGVWRLGPAGVDVPLTIAREGATSELRVRSADRNSFLKKPRLH